MTDDNATFSHFDGAGNARMVDVGAKNKTARIAVAAASVSMSAKAFSRIRTGGVGKGDVLGVARIAGIMAAKKVDQLIPLAHPILIDRAEIDFSFQNNGNTVEIIATVSATGKTGVEMEALTAVSVAALTVYDMCKSIDREMIVGNIRLLEKSGGKSGLFRRD